jgi:A/G-specific adenine glycosylase
VPQALTFGERLLEWGAQNRRDLPWRNTRDAWAVLVSEVMLQQTQVARVRPAYVAFLDRFPTVAACAAAPAAEVVRVWSGLGYNRRALQLHRCAQKCVERHGGAIPDSLDQLLALPGIGPYTARAVLAFAFERDVGVIDTNAARVLARAVAARRLVHRDAQELADELVPAGRAWEWNQAMLDLGAGYCRAKPLCDDCPVDDVCSWHSARRTGDDPAAGSFGTSGRQSRFDGSDRQGRGRLVEALRSGPVGRTDLPAVMGWPGDVDRAERVAATVVADGLASDDGKELNLRQ